jgi:tRNA pseudouridine55 synthase
MLVVCLGEASKTASFMLEAGKSYRAVALLGEATTTGDTEGEVIQSLVLPELTPQAIEATLLGFLGDIQQVPPMYSALKHEGKPLYEYARAGIDIERPARGVTIHDIRLVEWQAPKLTFEVRCSKGTYIRTLAEDIARELGSCAHLVGLRRLVVEPFDGAPMHSLEHLQECREQDVLASCLLPVDAGLADWPMVRLDDNQRIRFSHGNPFSLPSGQAPPGRVRVLSSGGDVLGLATLQGDGVLKALKVFNL